MNTFLFKVIKLIKKIKSAQKLKLIVLKKPAFYWLQTQ